MSNSAVSALFESGMEKGGRYMVLQALAHYLCDPDRNDPNALKPDEVTISRQTIVSLSRVTEAQVKRIMRDLLKEGLLEIIGKGGKGPTSTNVYRLHFLSRVETAGFACKQARRAVFAGMARALDEAGLIGCPASEENVRNLVTLAADKVASEGHEKLAMKLRHLIEISDPELAEKGGHYDPLSGGENKGVISELRGSFEQAKGVIWAKKLFILDSIGYSIARVGARAVWKNLGEVLFENENLAAAITWLGDGVTVTEFSAEHMRVEFSSRLDLDRFSNNHRLDLRRATDGWAGCLELALAGQRGVKYHGRGMRNFYDMAQAAILAEPDQGDEVEGDPPIAETEDAGYPCREQTNYCHGDNGECPKCGAASGESCRSPSSQPGPSPSEAAAGDPLNSGPAAQETGGTADGSR